MTTKFIVFGAMAAMANVLTRMIFSMVMPYGWAIAVAYMVGLITGFTLFKVFVFNAGQSKKTPKEFIWFIIINLLAFLQTMAISFLLRDIAFPYVGYTFHAEDIAHIVGVAFPILSSYFGHKYITFKQ